MDNQFGSFWLGANTLRVPMTLHQETRAKLIKGLSAASKNNAGNFVLLEGGKEEMRHDTDHEKLFRQESYFHYLFGVKEPGCYGAIDVASGTSYLFVPRLPDSYAVWMGEIKPTSYFSRVYMVDECYYSDEINQVLKDKGCKKLLILKGTNSDSDAVHRGATFEGMKENFEVDYTALYSVLQECRVVKTEAELEVMRYVAKISCDAHNQVMREAKPNMMEYELESVFKHSIFQRGGCRHCSYTCICGSGPNGAILHYGHAGAPNSKQILDGEMMMFDMGGEYYCYGADISRSFPISGKFTDNQKMVYETVLAAQTAVMEAMKPGVSWSSMHRLADRVICEKFKEHGLLHGDVDIMMKHFVGSLFMPHGLGHLLGIDTHDVGGYPEGGSPKSNEPGLRSLRMNRDLLPGMVLTVEPGVYFIKALLEPAFENPEISKFLNIPRLKELLNFGGIRIEDDVIVLENGIENMSRFSPRSVEDIEALMRGEEWSS